MIGYVFCLFLACLLKVTNACEWYEGEGEFVHADLNRGLYTKIIDADTLEKCSLACCEITWCNDLSFYTSNNECILYVRDPDIQVPLLYCDSVGLNISDCGGNHGPFIKKSGVISRTRVKEPIVYFSNPYNQTNRDSFATDFIGKGKCINKVWPEGDLGYHHDFIFEKNYGKENCIKFMNIYAGEWQSWANYIEKEDHSICRFFFRSSDIDYMEYSEETGIGKLNKRGIDIDCDLDICDDSGAPYEIELVESENENDWCAMFQTMTVNTNIDCNNPYYVNETIVEEVCIKIDAKCSKPQEESSAILLNVPFNFLTDMSYYCIALCDRNPEWCLGYNLYKDQFRCEFITTREIFYKHGTEIPLYDVDLSGNNIDYSIDFSEFHYCSQFTDNVCSKSIEPFYYQRTDTSVCGIVQNNCSVFEYFPSITGKCDGDYDHEYLLFHSNSVPSVSNFCRNKCCNIDWCDAYEIDENNCYFIGKEMPNDDIVNVTGVLLLNKERDVLELDKGRSCVAKLSSREQTCPSELIRFEGKDIFKVANIYSELTDIYTEEECVKMCCKHSFWCQAATFYGDDKCTLYTKYSSLDKYTIMDDKIEETFQESFLGDNFEFNCNEIPCKNHSSDVIEDYKLATGFNIDTSTTFMNTLFEFDVLEKFVKIDDNYYFDDFTVSEFVESGKSKDECFQHAIFNINSGMILDLSSEDFLVVFKEDEIDETKRCVIARINSFENNTGIITGNKPGAMICTVPFLENIEIICPTQTDTSYCISEYSKCISYFGNEHFVTLPIVETSDVDYAKTLCFNMCKKNKVWCQGIDFDLDSLRCKLFTTDTIFFEPGIDTEVPLYSIYDEYELSNAPICTYRKDYPSCSETDIFPIVPKYLDDNICAISISGTCDANLRRHFKGHCYGNDFKDYVYTLNTLDSNNEIISRCKELCCEVDWCNALEVLFEKEIGHECIFMVDKSNENSPNDLSVEVGDIFLVRKNRILNQDVELGRLCFAYDYAIETSLHPNIPMIVVGDACGKSDGSYLFRLGKINIDYETDDDTLDWCYQKCENFGSACTGIEYLLNRFYFHCFILTDMVSLYSFNKNIFQRVIDAIEDNTNSISVDIDGDIFTSSITSDIILKDSSEITPWPISEIENHHFYDDGRTSQYDISKTCMVYKHKVYNYLENTDLSNDQPGECPTDEYFYVHKFESDVVNHCAKLCHHIKSCKAYFIDGDLCKVWADTTHPNFNIFSWDGGDNFVQFEGSTFSEICGNQISCSDGGREQYNLANNNENNCILNSDYTPYQEVIIKSYVINPLFVGMSSLVVILLIVFNRQVKPTGTTLSLSRYIIGIIIVANIFYITFIVNNTTELGAKVLVFFTFAVSGLIFMSVIFYFAYFDVPSKENIVFGLLTLSMFNMWIILDYYVELKLEQIILITLTTSCILLIIHFYYFDLMDDYLWYAIPLLLFLVVIADVSYALYEFVDLSLTVSISIGVGILSFFICCGCVCVANTIDDE